MYAIELLGNTTRSGYRSVSKKIEEKWNRFYELYGEKKEISGTANNNDDKLRKKEEKDHAIMV